jgi:acyl-CoA synthetase (AMP-forming)/AMP-acid ligase II
MPDRCALVSDGDRLSYRQLMHRASQLAQHLIASGLRPDETVGLYMLNSAAYVESLLACMLGRLIPVNINYRYTGSELAHLFTLGRLAGLIVDAEHAPLAAAVAAGSPALRHVLVTGDGGTLDVSFPAGITAVDYGMAFAAAPPVLPDNGRSGDDKIIIYTGGTTGLPKGVLWRHEDFYFSPLSGLNAAGPPRLTVGEIVAAARELPPGGWVITPPLMHSAGTWSVFAALLHGLKVVLSRKFDPAQALRLVSAEDAMGLAVVGDAMARPIVDELAAHPGEYDLSSLVALASGGVRLSRSVREQFLAACPNLLIADAFGSSETGVNGQLGQAEDGRPRLVPRGNVTVMDEALRPVAPGGIGRIATSGHVPLGYYGDEAATKATFPVIDGVRWALLGDMAEVDRDGSIIVLGRGSMCINTGGEKVYPEEVERALTEHPAVMDALVTGLPDERFGERVAAVVSLRPGTAAGTDALREHCRGTLAGYKVPARIKFVTNVVRSPTGKADYRWARAVLAGREPAPSGPTVIRRGPPLLLQAFAPWLLFSCSSDVPPRLAGFWLLLVSGGGPAAGKPTVVFRPPADADQFRRSMRRCGPGRRVAHCAV